MENLRQQFESEIKTKNPKNWIEVISQADIKAYTTWLENKANQYKTKSDKWDKLDEEIGRFYENDWEELSDADSEEGDLADIGEVEAQAFGYL